jgi:hypothetical protein
MKAILKYPGAKIKLQNGLLSIYQPTKSIVNHFAVVEQYFLTKNPATTKS